MHVRTFAAGVGLLLLMSACGQSEAQTASSSPAPAPKDSATLESSERQEPRQEGDYWTPKRLAALEAAKASFVPPEPSEPAAATAESTPAPQPAPPVSTPAASTATQSQPSRPAQPPRQTTPTPAKQPTPTPTPTPAETAKPLLPLPEEDGPLFVVADRTAAVAITGCTVADSGQRRIAYDVVLLRDGAELPVLAERVEAEHSPTSRTILVSASDSSQPMSFVLVEDDPERTEDFTVPAVRELHLGSAEDGTTVVVPSAIVPVQACG